MTAAPVLGAILAGGGSTRLGGGDKGLRTVGGEAMIARAAAVLRDSVAGLLLVANGDPDRFDSLGMPVVADEGGPRPGEGSGPLAGVLAALEVAAATPGMRHVLTVPADAPFLPEGLVEALLDAAWEGETVVVAASETGRHPVVALWPVSMRAAVRRALEQGSRKLSSVIEAGPHREVRFPPIRAGDELVDPFFNVNTEADLAEAERISRLLGRPEAIAPAPAPARGRLPDDCFAPGAGVMRHDEAVALVVERVGPVTGTEEVPLDGAFGRVLAEAVAAPRDVPLADTSAVDGYAFRAADHESTGGFMPVAGRVFAGTTDLDPLPPFAAARIFTGAAMPEGANTVAMQEDCETHEQDGATFVIVPAGLRPGANRRRAGEDIAAGAVVMEPGLKLRPQDVGALASLGRERVTVRRRLSVALASTGDEVVRPGRDLAPGQVYDSNHALVSALAAAAGCDLTDLGVIPDDAAAVEARIAEAAARHDLVITSGGVSEGDADHVAAAISRLGERHLWKIAVKPGRPLAVGRIGDCVLLGLPGNPVAAFAGFLLYGLPLVSRLAGATWTEPPRFSVPSAFSIRGRRTGRREFLRGILLTRPDGTLAVDRYARDGSSLISGLRAADGFIDIPEDCEAVEEGQPVRFLPFSGFGLGFR